MSSNKLKYASCMSPFSPPFYKETRYIQANRTTDSLLIKSVLSCKTSLYGEYKCNMEHKWTKRIIINNDWNFHCHGRAWMNLFRTSPHTSEKNPLQSYTVAGSYLGFPFIISHLQCIFTFNNLTTLIWIILFGRKQESNYVVLSRKWTFILNMAGLLIWSKKKKKSVSCVFLNCVWDASIFFQSLFRQYNHTEY